MDRHPHRHPPHDPARRRRGPWSALRARLAARRLRGAAARFVAAERSANDAASEAALRALFAALPRRAPRTGFADRVLAAAGVPRPRTSPLVRWATVPALVLAALSLGVLAPLAPRLLGLAAGVAPAALLAAAVEGLAGLVAVVELASPLWRLALALSRAAGAVAGQPQVLALVLVSAAAAAALERLARPALADDLRRSSVHG